MSATYRLCKTVITAEKARGVFVKENMLHKLDVFLMNDRITEAEYSELVAYAEA